MSHTLFTRFQPCLPHVFLLKKNVLERSRLENLVRMVARAPGVAQQQTVGMARDAHLTGGSAFFFALAIPRHQYVLVRQGNRDFMEGQKRLPDTFALVLHDHGFLDVPVP